MAGIKEKTLSEENLTSILTQLDITLSALRDAICDSGVDATTLKDVKDAVDSLETLSAEITKWGGTSVTGRDISLDLKALTDDSIKGILKSLGDIGAGSNIATLLDNIKTATEKIDDLQGALKSVDTDELISRITDSTGAEVDPAIKDQKDLDTGAGTDDHNVVGLLKEGTGGATVVDPATEGKQDTEITALEKIDDLQGALKSVDSDELITRVTDSAGAEINPAKEDGNLSTVNTNIAALTKTEDTAHSTGDKGIVILGVRKDDVAELSSDDGDYNVLVVNEDGILRTQAQQHLHLDEMGATTGWTVLGNDTVNFSTTTNHVLGTLALEFDKVHGAADTVFAGIQKTLSGLPSFRAYEKGNGFFVWSIYLSSLSDVDYVFLRLGTNSSNYNEWRVDGDGLSIGWNALRMVVLAPKAVVGNGWNSGSVTYGAVGVAFDNKTDTLADIAVDHLALNTGLQTSADITAEVTSEVSTPNVKVQKWKNYNVDTNAGSVGNGTLRTTLASDDPAVATLGATDDAAASAGGVGSVSAKLRHVSGRAGTTGEAASTSGSEAAQARSIGVAVESLDTKEGTTGAVAAADGTRAAQLRAIADDLDSLDTKEGTTGEAASVSGTRAAQLRAIATALEIMDDWDESDRAKVNTIAGQVGVAGGSGVQSALTQRVVTATDSPEVTTIGGTADAAVVAGAVGSLSAKLRAISRDLVANIVLATGANAIGKLAANSGVDIGDVNAPVLETLASSVAITPTQITKTVAAIGTPEALAADGTYFRTATILGKKAARTDNVGNVYLGIGGTNDTQPYEIGPGEEKTLNAPPGEKYDLNDWYCDVLNAGDGVIVIYS